jgi:hypothetical protein
MWENKGRIQNLGNSNGITNLKQRANKMIPLLKAQLLA